MSFTRRSAMDQSDMDVLADGCNAALVPGVPYDFYSGPGWSYELSRIRTDLFRRTNYNVITGYWGPDSSLIPLDDSWLVSGPHCVGVGPTLWALSYQPDGGGLRQFLYKDAKFLFCASTNPATFQIHSGAILGTPQYKTQISSSATVQVIYTTSINPTELRMKVVVDFHWTGGGSPPATPSTEFTLAYNVNGVDQLATDVTATFAGSGSPTNQNVRMTLVVETTNCPAGTDVTVELNWTPAASGYVPDTAYGTLEGFWKIEALDSSASTAYLKAIHPRNEIARLFAHFGGTITLVEADGDILDSGSLVNALDTRPRAVDDYFWNRLSTTAQDIINDPLQYPPVSGTLLTQIYTDMNAVINGSYFYTAAIFAGVTLRALTQWLAQVPDISGTMLKLLNRLLLEDAYPTYIARIDTAITGADEEIRELGITHNIGSGDALAASGIGTAPFGFQCSDPLCDGVWLANTLPPPAINGFCDIGNPLYYSGDPPIGSDGAPVGTVGVGSTMRDYSPTSSGGAIGQHAPAVDNRPCRWPVIRDLDFGYWTQGTIPTGYWIHAYHNMNWLVKDYPVAAGQQWNGSFLLAANPNPSGTFKYELRAFGNGTLYISSTGVPDPANPATYDFTANKTFTIPDDVPGGLLATYNAGGYFYFAFHNDSGSATTFGYRNSTIYYFDGNGDALQVEPFFFPYEEFPTDVDSRGVPRVDTFPYFLYFEGRNCPRIQTRGHAVYELVVQLLPTVNAYGIYKPTLSTGDTVVKVGIMVGTGIFTGAITGVYPGEFLEFDTITIPNGEQRKITSVHYPVLEGCPLAYQCDVQVDVFAYVNYQPVFNSAPAPAPPAVDGNVVQYEYAGPALGLMGLSGFNYPETEFWMFRAPHTTVDAYRSPTLWPPSGEIVQQHRDLVASLPP